MFGSLLLLIGLAKWAEKSGNVLRSAAFYALVVFIFSMVFPVHGFETALVGGIAAFIGSWLLFGLLVRFQDSILLWILALIVGLVLMGAVSQVLKASLIFSFKPYSLSSGASVVLRNY